MKQPDDPGVPPELERQARKNGNRLLAWILMIALILVLGLLSWQPAAAQDPPVPLEEPCPAGDCTVYNQAFIFAFTGAERMIRWSLDDAQVASMDLFTELTVFEFPPKAVAFPVMRAELPEADRSIGWTPNRAGTYFVKARACRTDVPDPPDPDAEQHPTRGLILCSIMAESLDPAHTSPDVYPRGFVMLIKLAPATGGGIE